jgi:hypothetical protein
MATATPDTTGRDDPLAVAVWRDDGEPDTKSERYLARRLAAATADFKGVALTTFVLAAGVAAMLWLACGVVTEHWMVPGGLPRWARWAWLAVGLAALVAATIRWIVPLLRYRVNLVYAARAIERDNPDLHNDLVNAVLVKARPDAAPPRVARSIERRAAKRLAEVPAEGVIDRTAAVRLAYALAALVTLACVYELAAPKSLMMTAARLAAPWSSLAAPARVRIDPPRLAWRMPGEEPPPGGGADEARSVYVSGGTATLVRGRQLVVAAAIRGLRRGERALLLVTPLREDGGVDAGAAPWQAEMTPNATAGGHVATLPDQARGLDRSLELVIAAGDARSERLRVAVVDEPALLVRRVTYEYPAYTRLPAETVAWQGDLRAVEGTKVTLEAESNQPLEAAWIDLDCEGKRDVRLRVGASDLARATGGLVLRLNRDRSGPEHASYRLLFQPRGATAAHREQVIAEKMEHRIEVQADLAPEVAIESPTEATLQVPPGAVVPIGVRAVDPDFGLARVGIEARLQGGATAPETVIFRGDHQGPWRGVGRLDLGKLAAGPGSVVEYRAVAADNRPETPNAARTEWKTLHIDASAPPPPQPPAAPNKQSGDRQDGAGGSGEPQAGQGGGEKGAAGEKQAGGGEGGAGSQADGGKGERGEKGGKGSDGGKSGASDPQSGGREGNESQKGNAANDAGSGAKPKQDPNQGDGEQGEPQQGGQQGAADGSQSKDGSQGRAGNQPGSQQRPGAQDGAGNQQNGGGGQGGANAGAQAGGQQQGGKQAGGTAGTQGERKPSGDTSGDGAGNQAGKGSQAGGREGQAGTQGGGTGAGKQAGKSPPQNTVAADGTNDGEAMERILEHRNRDQGGDASQDGGGAGQQRPSQLGEQSGQPGQPGQKGAGQGQQSGQPSPQGGSQPGQGGEAGAAGEQSAGSGGQQGQGEGREGQAQQGQGQQGQGEGREGQGQQGQGEGREGQAQQGQGQQGQGQQGQGQQGQGQQGQGQQGQGQQGQGQQGQGQQGQGQQGQGQQGQGQQGQGQQGQGQQGQGQQGQGQQGQGEGREGQAQQGQGQQGQGQQGQGQQGQGQQGQGQQGQGQQGQGQQGQGQQGQGEGREGQAQQGAGQQGEAAGAAGEESVQPGAGQAAPGSQVGQGGQAAGGQGGGGAAGANRVDRETEWGEQDLANARNAADLAVEHLRDSIAAGRTDVLDSIGWTPEQARAFLDRWEAMKRMAGSPDPRRRGEFEKTLRSLGLRPGGARSSRDVPADVKGGQAEGRRSRPPAGYREQLKAYLQGTGGE